jgi:hypothetical protein
MRLAGLFAAQVISQTPGSIHPLDRRAGKRGPNPTDRAKMGTKKSLLVEQHGGPLGVRIAGAGGWV